MVKKKQTYMARSAKRNATNKKAIIWVAASAGTIIAIMAVLIIFFDS